MKITKQIFLFLVPTLISVLIFMPVVQQNNFFADVSDNEILAVKAGSAEKFVNYNIFSLLGGFLGKKIALPILLAGESLVVCVFLLKSSNLAQIVKNKSPPANIVA